MRSDGFVVAVAFAAGLAWACTRREPPAPRATATSVVDPSGVSATATRPDASTTGSIASGQARELTWTYPATPVGLMSVVVSIPAASPGTRLPVLVAMHGRGEALKGPERGARGWIDDYDLYTVIDRLAHPPLRDADFLGFASSDRLHRMNDSLAKTPYRGLIVVMPYTPDILRGDEPLESAKPLARFIVAELLPRVYRETPAVGTAASTGIDGVSLGGRAAISVGLLRPASFAVVASLQAGLTSDEVPQIVAQARRAKQENPGLRIRLLTSTGDYYLGANKALSSALDSAGIAHSLLVVPGPHDYVFNRGPGAYEMLLFHDRALHGDAPP